MERHEIEGREARAGGATSQADAKLQAQANALAERLASLSAPLPPVGSGRTATADALLDLREQIDRLVPARPARQRPPRVIWWRDLPWRVTETGGGCEAYRAELNDYGEFCLATEPGDATLPRGPVAEVGSYGPDDEEDNPATEVVPFNPQPARVIAYRAGGNSPGDFDLSGAPVVPGAVYVAVRAHNVVQIVSPNGFTWLSEALAWARLHEWLRPYETFAAEWDLTRPWEASC